MKNKSNCAAVLVLLTELTSGDHVLLTKRAVNLSSHGGEVAFPGGKWDPTDESLCATALRESHEEVGLAPGRVEILGQLPVAMTRYQTSVTPYVGRVANNVELSVNKAELDICFWVPIDFFCTEPHLRIDVFNSFGEKIRAAAYQFEDYIIWGVTARILVDLLNQYYGTKIHLD